MQVDYNVVLWAKSFWPMLTYPMGPCPEDFLSNHAYSFTKMHLKVLKSVNIRFFKAHLQRNIVGTYVSNASQRERSPLVINNKNNKL